MSNCTYSRSQSRHGSRKKFRRGPPHFTPAQAAGRMLNGTLPPRAIVDGDLTFMDERVPVFAAGMWIRGNLRVVNCGGVTSLPRNLRIDGFADFSMTPIAELPEGMRVGEWLDLSDTRVRELPADLTVGWRILGFRPAALAA